MPTRTEAIKAFLMKSTLPDLAELYNYSMEVQVNVAQDGGERVEGEYKGRAWHGWSDGLGNIWKSFRIPFNAGDRPYYSDSSLNFDLAEHAEGVGMTGWDWEKQCSRWVAFDFDAIINHTDALTLEELTQVRDVARQIPWVSVRKSTSGKGLHLYVFLDPAVPTDNHHEHAALARAILGQMAAHTGFNFQSQVDICGGNMWCWHRKVLGTDGLELIKQGDNLINPPDNWRDHIAVTKRQRNRALPNFAEKDEGSFEELTGQRSYVKLDEEHRALINYLDVSGASFWWNQDHHMLIAHTYDLLQAHKQLSMRGTFKTVSTGKDQGADHNCFLFPLRRGGWCVRRYTPGIAETDTWDQDNAGWTRCYLNVDPDLKTAARASRGLEDDKGNFVFPTGQDAEHAITLLGANLKIDYPSRPTTLRYHKDGRRLVVEVERRSEDPYMQDWLSTKNNKLWQRIVNIKAGSSIESDVGNYDEIIRHLTTPENADGGWTIKSGVIWNTEPLTHVRAALDSMGLKAADVKAVIGNCVIKPWKIVNKPFQSEYPGDRSWNRNAAQLAFAPSNDRGPYETWLSVLDHVGENLTPAIQVDEWCQINGLRSGADYLKCWIASLFQQPNEPLPYLFLYGPQASGKSILHEALNLLVTRGCVRAENALISSNGYNGELEHAILCVVEEVDLHKNKIAYNRIKDWSTSLRLPIHKKYVTPYLIDNTTHWVQCANMREACPVFEGDTRITMVYVSELKQMLPKRDLLTELKKEAPDFLTEILQLELPKSNDRLNVPVLHTDDKVSAGEVNKNALDIFISEHCHYVPGAKVSVAEFYDAFQLWLEPIDRGYWTKIKIGREMPAKFPKGRDSDASWAYGNLSFTEVAGGRRLISQNNKLVEVD